MSESAAVSSLDGIIPGLSLWQATSHQWGRGKVHLVDDEDFAKLYCGRRKATVSGVLLGAGTKKATCRTCLLKHEERPQGRRPFRVARRLACEGVAAMTNPTPHTGARAESIWLVTGHSGVHDSYSEWPVRAFATEHEALVFEATRHHRSGREGRVTSPSRGWPHRRYHLGGEGRCGRCRRSLGGGLI